MRFRKRLLREVSLLMLGLVALLASVRAFNLYRQRAAELDEAGRLAAHRAALAAQYLRGSFRSLDAALRQLVALAPEENPVASVPWERFLEAFRSSLGSGSITVVDAQGTIRFATIPALVGTSRADDYLFRRLKEETSDVLIADRPLRRHSGAHAYLIPLGRRIVDAHGRFAGIVVATFLPETLHDFFKTIELGAGGAISVLHPDGVLLFREPAPTNPIGDAALEPRLAAKLQAGDGAGVERASLVGAGPSVLAWQPLEEPRLYVAVSSVEAEVLAGWRRECAVSAALFAFVIVLVLVALRLLSREVQARDRAELATAELRSDNRDLQRYIDGMATMNAKVALDGTLLMVNAIGARAAGMRREELIGASFLDGPWWTFDPDVHARVGAAFRRACAGEPASYDERLKVFGTLLDVSFGLAPVKDADGKVLYVIAEARDISDLKRSERELAERTQDLEAFSYSVSHDLRAPLRAITGFASALLEDFGSTLDAEAQRMLSVIRDRAGRMGNLVDDLLQFSRLGRAPVNARRVAMRALVLGVVEELPEEDGGKIEIGDLAECRGDALLLRQVWVNLIGNAVKFSRTTAAPRIAITSVFEGRYLAYSVRDNGVGFDMRYASKLFSVFERLHSQDEFEGTGVGLAIVKRIVERHGGSVRAESVTGEGACFTFLLPMAESGADG